ncbi:helix-turn-helix domain-containing protein [Streptococcus castoreus]|uniref:helix-turn-helix domain-containing protein n=1 Tax=Streptococcus castoreus TaxID=254786 RepID=UPI0004160127|nr:helix-turn-helix domain-containing protein [Streptococcus castoreus]
MIEKYLEKTINDKINLINLFFRTPTLTLTEASLKTNLSASKLMKHCRELNTIFKEQLSITNDKREIHCHLKDSLKEFYLHELYQKSNVLQLLKFLIQNDTQHKPLSSFAKQQFLSSSAAYRIRESIMPLLEEFNLRLSKNTILGEEYRLRYFIALLQSKFGIEIYHVSAKDKMVIREFLFMGATNLRASNALSESFLFFDILLTLLWKRHDKHVHVPSSEMLTSLKEIAVYDYLSDCAGQIIEPRQQIRLDSNDLDYLFLVYLTAVNSFAAQKWSDELTEQIVVIISSNTSFQSLFQPISDLIPLSAENHDSLLRIVVYFAHHFILNLQQFIPEKNYFSLDHYPGDLVVLEKLKPIVMNWLQEIKGTSLNQQYFFLFCRHIEQLIRNNLPKITVVLLTTDFVNAQLLTDYIYKHLSSQNIVFYSYYLLADNIYNIRDLNADIIITHKKLIPFVKEELAQDAVVTDFDYIETRTHIHKIQNIILSLEEKNYQHYIHNHFKK